MIFSEQKAFLSNSIRKYKVGTYHGGNGSWSWSCDLPRQSRPSGCRRPSSAHRPLSDTGRTCRLLALRLPLQKGSIVAVVVINFQESSHKAGTWDCCSFIFTFLSTNFSTGLNLGEIRNPLAKEVFGGEKGSLWRHEEDFVKD